MVSAQWERGALQAAVAISCLSPIAFGLNGVVEGPPMLAGVEAGASPADLVSHYRFLSGLLLGLGLTLLSCVPRIEARTARFRWAAGAIVGGGIARLAGLGFGDTPSAAHGIALAAELGLVPLLLLWQGRVARRSAGTAS